MQYREWFVGLVSNVLSKEQRLDTTSLNSCLRTDQQAFTFKTHTLSPTLRLRSPCAFRTTSPCGSIFTSSQPLRVPWSYRSLCVTWSGGASNKDSGRCWLFTILSRSIIWKLPWSALTLVLIYKDSFPSQRPWRIKCHRRSGQRSDRIRHIKWRTLRLVLHFLQPSGLDYLPARHRLSRR